MTAQKRPGGAQALKPAPKRPESTSGAPPAVSATGSSGTRATTWRLWFPAQPHGKGGRVVWRYPPNTNERRKMHHMAEAREVKAWRTEAALLGGIIGRHQRIRVSAVVYRPRLGSADPDGDVSRVKPLLDGLVDAGVVPNDTHAHVEIGTVTEARSSDRPGEYPRGVELIVEVLA